MIAELTNLFQAPLGVWTALVSIGFSLLASIIAYIMYQLFYGSKHIGAGVHRVFLVGGPSITVIFLIIQTSIPLGIGLLGALSFVRFRTPIKDPAEIGFIFLLITSSIGMATGNVIPTAILFAFVFITLGVQHLISNRFTLFGRGYLMISIDKSSFPALEKRLASFLGERLHGLRLENMSTLDDRINLQYQCQRQSGFDWTTFTNELNQLSETAEIEVFVS
jgi:hypothetical protein